MPADQSVPRTYHHGDLRAALLRAATEELAERGVEGFTLRSCARRAGVSHAAPAHHFGDVRGLLTEVAIDAFERLAATIRSHADRVEPGSIDHLIAVALGYALFALAAPAEFSLMFRTEKLDGARSELQRAGSTSFGLAAAAVGAFYEVDRPMADPVTARRVVGLWSLSHGVASLLLAGQFGPIGTGDEIVHAIVPDMVRELFGVPARNEARDLELIAGTSAAQAP